MNLEVGENYFSFTMDPYFMVQKPIKNHKKQDEKSEKEAKDQDEEEKIK